MTFKIYILVFVIVIFIIIVMFFGEQIKKDYKRYLKKGGSLSYREFKEKYYKLEE